jgi:acyl-CoA thioester hydrolase
MSEDKTIRYTFRAPWVDCDPAGIMYFSHLLKYVEFAEFELYRKLRGNARLMLEEFNILLPRVEVHSNFFHPVRWEDVVEVHLRVARLTGKSVTYEFAFFHQGKPEALLKGRLTVVCVDREKFRAVPFPPPLYDLLNAHYQPGET